ncbi:MAG TPA: S41 family peptidase [Dehalococcoidia bacterium]|nr:S41 family peptidase [Dehalococcoidia bacterium]
MAEVSAQPQEPKRPRSDRLIKILLGAAAVLIVVIVGIASFVAGRESKSTDSAAADTGSAADQFNYDELNQIHDLLEKYYVQPENLDNQALFEAAINGMLGLINDAGTYYVNPDDFKLSTTLTGSFDGIGATVASQSNEIVIVAPIKGTPAEKAGLVSGDAILAVDGESTDGWTVDKTVLKIRGTKGTPVTIKIKHTDGTVQDYTLTRDTVQVDSVTTDPPSGKLTDTKGNTVNNIGYVYIREFTPRTPQELETAVQSELAQGAKGLIIDVRSDPGGLLDSAITIADQFLDNGTILIERNAAGQEVTHSAQKGQLAADIPIVMVQDRFSASASEILLAALRENGRATSVGETSFGKGTVNSAHKLPDGGALFVSIEEWLTPDHTLISRVGLTPDVAVTPTDEDIDTRNDVQLQRAVEVMQGKMAQSP